MSYRDKISSEVKDATTTDNSNDGEDFEQIDVDMGEIPFVKSYPTTVLQFDFPDPSEGNPIILFKDRNRLSELRDKGSPHIDDNGNDLRFTSTRYLGLVVDDIRLAGTDEFEGQSIIETGADDSTEYRAVNFDTDGTSYKYNGAAVDVNGDVYDIENEVEQIGGRAILVIDRTAYTSVAKKLDVNGGTNAGMDEATGDVNGGLVEHPPSDAPDGAESRFARPFVELRDDLQGETAEVSVTYRSEVDDDWAEMIAEDDDQNDMMWYSVFDGDGNSVTPTTGEPALRSYLQWRFDAEAGTLPEADMTFVEQYVQSDHSTDEQTIRDNIEGNLDKLSDDPNKDRIVELVQREAQ